MATYTLKYSTATCEFNGRHDLVSKSNLDKTQPGANGFSCNINMDIEVFNGLKGHLEFEVFDSGDNSVFKKTFSGKHESIPGFSELIFGFDVKEDATTDGLLSESDNWATQRTYTASIGTTVASFATGKVVISFSGFSSGTSSIQIVGGGGSILGQMVDGGRSYIELPIELA